MHNRKKEADKICPYFYVDVCFHPLCGAPEGFRNNCGKFSTEKWIIGFGTDFVNTQEFTLYRCDKLKDQCDEYGHLPPRVALQYCKPLDDEKFAAATIDLADGKTWINKKIGRNEPCPCGSGKKYKHCCGKIR